MAFTKGPTVATGAKPKNKLRRQAAHLSIKRAKEAEKRDMKMRRKREEAKDVSLREQRLANNIPQTIDSKRTYDEGPIEEIDMLGYSVDVERLAKKRRLEEKEQELADGEDEDNEEGLLAQLKKRDADEGEDSDEQDSEQQEDEDSMLDFSGSDAEADSDGEGEEKPSRKRKAADAPKRASSPTISTVANLELSPEFLKQKFPQLYSAPEEPKILVTTSLNSTLHKEAGVLEELLPNATYIRRTAHAHAHKYSVTDIAQFAHNRGYTHVAILMQAMHAKKADGLDIIYVAGEKPGPHFHFTITNWIESKKLPGHGNPTGHIPELILNNFKTPLGLLSAQLFQTLYPQQPQFEGRTVVTLHNQRDYIFLRRHRYVFRMKRETEKPVISSDGKTPLMEDVKTGLQELGPRMTLKLRRIDRGVQFRSGQEWEWKGKAEKNRTRFAM